jgi:hypothetical protein
MRAFKETETLLQFANRLTEIFASGGPDRRSAVLKVVALNATLSGGKARLNLRTAFALVGRDKTTMPGLPTCPGIIHDVRTWLPIIRDVRTALAIDPLPLDTIRALLEA